VATSTLLYVTQVAPYRDGPAGVHGVLDQSSTAMAELAGLAGLGFHRVDDVTALDPGDLAGARAVVLFTIGETPWSEPQRAALAGGVRAGLTALVALHSATDSCAGWDEYGRLVGARFDGHPWTEWVGLEVVEPGHPALCHLDAQWRWYDEIYQLRDLRSDARVLLRVRESADGPSPAFGSPLSWCFDEGAGRVFSTTLGHFPAAWESPEFLRFVAGGLAWALGEGD
jgi:type 1 glutamine amidotransferase